MSAARIGIFGLPSYWGPNTEDAMSYHEVIQNPDKFDFTIERLGEAKVSSPLNEHSRLSGENEGLFVSDDRILLSREVEEVRRHITEFGKTPSFEKAGPHNPIFHDPIWSRAAIVTCGGLCPGLNNVIKGLVQSLWFDYGVRTIYGIRYGYQGLTPGFHHAPILLDPDMVDGIHETGGTILGSSRGQQDVKGMIDTLQRMNISMLFTIGGDGTIRGAQAIVEEIQKRGLSISVVAIPKTIDNDLQFTDRTFGFETAVYETFDVITAAHMEANGAHNGIGLVKLMGRDSGFIAAYASLASSVVNMCLIPEVPFTIEGENGLLRAIERRWAKGKSHMVIVVAEGAGQDLIEGEARYDSSGNELKKDIGPFLIEKINAHFEAAGKEIHIKYFDPSYSIRSAPAHGTDAILCYQLAENAVHAAMAGRTACVASQWDDTLVLVPFRMATSRRKQLDLQGSVWRAVLGSTRQNDLFLDRNNKN